MKIECPKCGHITIQSEEELAKLDHIITCPKCMSMLKIVDGIAYIPNEIAPAEELRHPDPEPPQFKGDLYYETHGHQTEGLDPLYNAAVAYIRTCNAISLPMLQRYFDIPPERAEQIMQQLENNGVVAPYDGMHPRKILIDHYQGIPSKTPGVEKYDPKEAAFDENGNPNPQQQIKTRSCTLSLPGCLIFLVLIATIIYVITQM
ncbi:MAG: hypothetical protein IK100_10560 [Muribaculaceae bacterium]|nr:hypothetical protein [Muribaculaceae bacterium]